MDTVSLLLKFVHVVSAIVWIGGLVALVTLNARMARAGNGMMMAALGQQSEFFGRSVLGPAMGLTLLAGLATAGVAGFPFTSAWIVWGIAGFVLSIAIGVVAVGRAAASLADLAREAGPGDPRVDAARRRLIALNVANILLLLSIVWAMVFKPAF
jgi:uncharacterized membrane protein